jgi:signal transduction histidine kinase
MSHEIRTPLNGIIVYWFVDKTDLDANQFEYVNIVNESAIYIDGNHQWCIRFSKIESGKLELNIEEIDLVGLASPLLFKHQAKLKTSIYS